MKTFFKGALFTAAAALMLTSCNKDQSAINKMEGEWTVKSTQVFVNEVEVIDTTSGTSTDVTTITFEACKLADNEFCNATLAVTSNGASFSTAFKYNVTEDGEKMTWDMDNDLTTTTDRINAIVEKISKKEVNFYYTEVSGSTTTKTVVVLEPK
jgi:uncharacterized lipoprotein YajG